MLTSQLQQFILQLFGGEVKQPPLPFFPRHHHHHQNHHAATDLDIIIITIIKTTRTPSKPPRHHHHHNLYAATDLDLSVGFVGFDMKIEGFFVGYRSGIGDYQMQDLSVCLTRCNTYT
jgi:hypothetical protein